MKGPCEYCDNPDKARWATQCNYVGQWPSRAEFIASTFDPPCALDEYDEGLGKRDRRSPLKMAIVMALTLLLIAVLAVFVSR